MPVDTATETERLVLKTPEERETYEAWENYYRRHGISVDGRAQKTFFEKVLAGIRPPTEPIADFEAQIGASRRDKMDVPLDRKLSPVEKDIWRINRNTVLEATGHDAYLPPPGKEVDFGQLNWDEYGWGRDEKNRAHGVLMSAFHVDKSTAVRAAEALLLAGYTADEVIEKAGTISNNDLQTLGGPMGVFRHVFSNVQHESTVKIVFGQEAFEQQMHGYGGDPQTMEDLAWRLSWTGAKGGPTGEWMQGKKHAMFEARGESYDEEINGKKIKRFRKGKYYVNENSFVNWFRDEMDVLWDIHGPNTPIQVMDQVHSRISNLNLIRFREMIEKQEAFKSEDGVTPYAQTWLKLQLEAATFQTLYDNDIIYRQSAAIGLEEWMKQFEQMSLMNPLTKLGFRTNLIQQLLLGTNVYKEGRADPDGGKDGKYLSDSKFGGAFAEMVLAFYNLGDFDGLQKALGSDSSFFTRAGWIKAIEGVANPKRPGGAIKLSTDERKEFDKAFGHSEKIETEEQKKHFIKFVNTLNTSNLPGSHLDLIVQQAISDSVVKRFDLQEASGFGLIVAQAWFFNRFMGGNARNDIQMAEYKDRKGKKFFTPNPSVHDKPSELFNLRANREKYASKGGGKNFGNLQTLTDFNAAALDPMTAIPTMEDVPVYDAFGKVVKDAKMQKSILWLITEAHNLQVRQNERIKTMRLELNTRHPDKTSAAHISLKDQINAEEKALQREYMHYVANNANFHENALREYYQVHLKAGKEFAERVMKGEGLEFNDFTHFDAWGGVTIKRDVLTQKFQKKLLGLNRDMVKKYKWMNFNEDARVPYYDRKTGEYGFRDGKLGERMFGYDLLNRKEFWMEDEHGKPIKVNGVHVIDYNKVNANRIQLMKQMFMAEIAGDMYSHQLINTGDQRFPYVYYVNMLEVLKKTLPGKLLIDEFAKHGIHIDEGFFTKEDMKWLKDRALNGNVMGIPMGQFGFYLKWVLTSMVDKTDKEGSGFGKAFGILVKGIISGY